ncbi:ATP-binding cassette domain-containing protein [Listeria seeligeri]|uniref:ABC transporter ATP-binding protein n=1 Tax=Listeria seeligeri TaxID=1640 RepID=UPI0018888B10|nr:ATP-binding cassette domain-containing protein [Listeria seeligeri]MBF2482497.1 ATP-binding cassette domain-containing protein [Listeria seeligeri]
MNYIKVNHLTKVINNHTVLDDIDFELKQGGIYSFIGHNGSGKTMLFRALCGFIAPTSGEVTINGVNISKAIMEDPDLLIFDEPTNSLDKAGSQSFIDLILDLKEKGKTILLASHHIADIDGISDEIFEMEAGQIINRRKA